MSDFNENYVRDSKFLNYVEFKKKYKFNENKNPQVKGNYAEIYQILENGKIEYIVKKHKNPDRFPNFIREINFLQSIEHPNIIKIENWTIKGNEYYFAEEYGTPFLEYLQNGKISDDKFEKILKDIFNVIVFLNKNNIVHLDIKIDNFIIGKDGNIKLIDFGISTYGYRYKNGLFTFKNPGYDLDYRDPQFNPITFNSGLSDFYAMGIVFLKSYLIWKGKGKEGLWFLYNTDNMKDDENFNDLKEVIDLCIAPLQVRKNEDNLIDKIKVISGFGTENKGKILPPEKMKENTFCKKSYLESVKDIQKLLNNQDFSVSARVGFLTHHLIHRVLPLFVGYYNENNYQLEYRFIHKIASACFYLANCIYGTKIITIDNIIEALGYKLTEKDILYSVIDSIVYCKSVISSPTYWDYAESGEELEFFLRAMLDCRYYPYDRIPTEIGNEKIITESESDEEVIGVNTYTEDEFDKKYESEASTVGIKNRGNTCYQNAALQMLYSIPEVREYIINYEGDEEKINALKSVFEQLKTPVEDDGIKCSVNPQYQKLYEGFGEEGRQEDADEFLKINFYNFLFDIIKDNEENQFVPKIEDLYELFLNFRAVKNFCKGEKTEKTKTEYFSSLLIPLGENDSKGKFKLFEDNIESYVKNLIKKQVNKIDFSESCPKSEEAKEEYQRVYDETLSDRNSKDEKIRNEANKKLEDSKVKNLNPSEQESYYDIVSKYLILNLNRFIDDRSKINNKIKIQQQIKIKYDDKLIKYNLLGIIYHSGEDIKSGHYTYIMYNGKGEKGDETNYIKVFDDRSVGDTNYKVDKIQKNAYILLYRKASEQSITKVDKETEEAETSSASSMYASSPKAPIPLAPPPPKFQLGATPSMSFTPGASSPRMLNRESKDSGVNPEELAKALKQISETKPKEEKQVITYTSKRGTSDKNISYIQVYNTIEKPKVKNKIFKNEEQEYNSLNYNKPSNVDFTNTFIDSKEAQEQIDRFFRNINTYKGFSKTDFYRIKNEVELIYAMIYYKEDYEMCAYINKKTEKYKDFKQYINEIFNKLEFKKLMGINGKYDICDELEDEDIKKLFPLEKKIIDKGNGMCFIGDEDKETKISDFIKNDNDKIITSIYELSDDFKTTEPEIKGYNRQEFKKGFEDIGEDYFERDDIVISSEDKKSLGDTGYVYYRFFESKKNPLEDDKILYDVYKFTKKDIEYSYKEPITPPGAPKPTAPVESEEESEEESGGSPFAKPATPGSSATPPAPGSSATPPAPGSSATSEITEDEKNDIKSKIKDKNQIAYKYPDDDKIKVAKREDRLEDFKPNSRKTKYSKDTGKKVIISKDDYKKLRNGNNVYFYFEKIDDKDNYKITAYTYDDIGIDKKDLNKSASAPKAATPLTPGAPVVGATRGRSSRRSASPSPRAASPALSLIEEE